MATAPYRFIPIEPDYVQAPPVARKDICFDKPLAHGSVSAIINVEWTAKTPVCIGAQGEGARVVEPLKVGKHYCLSGTSLRGMLRSVLEIATFSHLGRINGNHHHGVRDFTGMGPYHQIAGDDVKAGWLKLEERRWVLYPARSKDSKFVLVPIESIRTILPKDNKPSFEDWQESMSVAEKYAVLPPAYQLRPIKYFYSLEKEGRGLPKASLTRQFPGSQKPFQSSTHPNKDLYIICTGPYRQEATRSANPRAQTGTPKKNESLFPAPGTESFVVPQAWMNVFHGMHSEKSRDGGDPRGAWRTWLMAKGWTDAFKGFKNDDQDEAIPDCMKDERLGIPVFWKGDITELEKIDRQNPTPAGLQSFWFSLSRVMRVPHGFSVGDTASRLYGDIGGVTYTVPRLEEKHGWDFARAMFGEVDGANIDPNEAKRAKQADTTRKEDAQRGRVSIGFAYSSEKTRPAAETKLGVFAQPRDSFWPFYLRHVDVLQSGELGKDLTVSYSSENAVPAGRKRSVVRRAASRLFPQGNGKDSTMTEIRFLPAGTVFKGQIRVSNLHPVEFGALLYALTFGRPDGSRWHQVGRAKGMGHGALSARLSFARTPLWFGADNSEAQVQDLLNVKDWIDVFQSWMTQRMNDRGLPDHKDHPAIQMLEAMANPEVGDAMDSRNEFNTGELPNFKTWRDDAACLDGRSSGRYPLSSPIRR